MAEPAPDHQTRPRATPACLATVAGKMAAVVIAVAIVTGALPAARFWSRPDATHPAFLSKSAEPAAAIAQVPQVTAKGATAMTKPASALLPSLRPMAVDNRGQNYTVNGYLEFQMECLGESKDYDYWFFAGVGGDAHTQVFTADTTRYCNCLSHIDFSPELVKTWYDAVGYECNIVTEEQFNADRPRHVGELMKFIDRGIPIIAKQNKVDNGDFWLLVGYEDAGGQLLFVTDNTPGAETKHIRVPTNQHVNYLFILPGVKKQAPPLAEVYRKAVLNIPTLLIRPTKGDVSFGGAAFRAWADRLLAEDYAGWTDDQLNNNLWKLHNTYVCILSTNAYGPNMAFLNRAANLCPDLTFIPDVVKEYAEIGGLVKDLDAAGGNFNIIAATLRNKEAKQPIAEVLRRMAACCDRIVEIYRKNGYAPGTGVALPTAADRKTNAATGDKKETAMTKPARVVLPNLRPMAVNERGQNYTVNGFLDFQMECLGESRDYDYWFFAGVGGDAHTQVFTADTTKLCNYLSNIDFSPALVKTWYDAVGYDFTIITEEQFNADRTRYVGELKTYIDRGIPIIANHNTSEIDDFWLLIGYDDDGGQLLFVNNNYPGAEKKCFKVPTNQHVNYSFILPGAKKQAPPLADVYRKAVLNIPALLTRPKKGDLYYGRDAFEAWANRLLTEDYAGKTDKEVSVWTLHGTYVCIMATNGSMRAFLERAAKLCPDLTFLPEVSKEYAEMGRLWHEDLEAAGGSFNMPLSTLRNKEAKKPIAAVLRRAAACCDRIVEIYRKNGYAPGDERGSANGGRQQEDQRRR